MQDRVIGVNQSIREVNKNKAQYVYIAKDADKNVISDLEILCNNKNIEINYVDNMKKLGNMFKVQVKVAAVTILKGGE